MRTGASEQHCAIGAADGGGTPEIYVVEGERETGARWEWRGEIWIGGAGLARGYWRRPELTAERFVPDAFSGEEGGRLYRSGDLGRYRADGTLEYLGRMDDQVKIRGYRIELGEIESVLSRHEQVREAAVTVREDSHGDKRLIGYVTTRGEVGVSAMELRGWLKQHLPEYMIPAQMVVLEALPLTTRWESGSQGVARAGTAGKGSGKPGKRHREAQVEALVADIWGGRCWDGSGWERMKTFSSWEDIRCWRRRRFRGCALWCNGRFRCG